MPNSADGDGFKGTPKLPRLSLDNHKVANQVEGAVSDGAFPAISGRTVLAFNHGLQRIMPRACGHLGISARATGFDDLAVQGGLAERLILGVDNLLRGIAILRVQAGALSRLGVNTVDQTETVLHRHGVQPTREVNRVVTVLPACWQMFFRVHAGH